MAKIKSLKVRPCKSADVAFPVQGIIEDFSNKLRLGAKVEKFELSEFIQKLSEFNSDGTPKIALNKLFEHLQKNSLANLRNNKLGYDLQQMEAERAKQYLDWHKHSSTISAVFKEVYKDGIENKVSILESLRSLVEKMYSELKTEYESKSNTNVVVGTSTTQENTSNSEIDSYIASIRMQQKAHTVDANVNPGGGQHVIPDISSVPQKFIDGAWADMQDEKPEFHSQKNKSQIQLKGIGNINNGEYRHPYLMSQAQRHEYTMEILDRILSTKVIAQKVPDLEKIWQHDLSILSSEVNKAQTALINTFLFVPFDGEITGIYKNPGEAVRAGESVLRIEDNTDIYLVGIVQHSGLLKVSDDKNVSLSITLNGNSQDLKGRIVSIRGHESDDDMWDVILKFDNSIGLPTNYTLDYRNATISFF